MLTAADVKKVEDLDLALKVTGAAQMLNNAIDAAYEAGLLVQLDLISVHSVGRRTGQQLVSVEISRPLLKS